MVDHPRRGEIWWAEQPDKRRPVLVLTRDAAIPVLGRLIVAPVTRTIRPIPTQVALDAEDGMLVACAVALDNITVADKTFLTTRLTRLSVARMAEVCRALATATSCRW